MIAPIPLGADLSNWHSYVEAARKTGKEARDLLSIVSPITKSGKSPSEVFEGIEKETEGKSILEELAKDVDVKHFLGDSFIGADTDLASLRETHAWGESVMDIELPPLILKKLLDPLAKDNLTNMRELFNRMTSALDRSIRPCPAWNVLALSIGGNGKSKSVAMTKESFLRKSSSVLKSQTRDCEMSSLGLNT